MPKLDLDNLFKYHAPTLDQLRRFRRIRIAAKEFAQVITETVRESPEQTLAIRQIHLAMMQANAAIAVNENDNLHLQNDDFAEALNRNSTEISKIINCEIDKGRIKK